MDPVVAFSSFWLLFTMELGDKTQLLILSMTARTGKARTVLLGSTVALMGMTLLGVALGATVGHFIPITWLTRLAGGLFIAIGGFMLWNNLHDFRSHGGQDPPGRSLTLTNGPLGGFFGILGAIALAEMGDKSQLAIVGLAANSKSLLAVFIGASLALVVVALMAAMAGRLVTRLFSLVWIRPASAVLFVIVGVLTLAGQFGNR